MGHECPRLVRRRALQILFFIIFEMWRIHLFLPHNNFLLIPTFCKSNNSNAYNYLYSGMLFHFFFGFNKFLVVVPNQILFAYYRVRKPSFVSSCSSLSVLFSSHNFSIFPKIKIQHGISSVWHKRFWSMYLEHIHKTIYSWLW